MQEEFAVVISGSNLSAIVNCYNKGTVTGGYVSGVLAHGRPSLQNCYNLGIISGTNIRGGLYCYDTFEVKEGLIANCYNIDTIYFGEESALANTTVTNTGLINVDGTFPNATPYADLLTALNAWVDANKSTYPELKNWVMGSNGFPTFAE